MTTATMDVEVPSGDEAGQTKIRRPTQFECEAAERRDREREDERLNSKPYATTQKYLSAMSGGEQLDFIAHFGGQVEPALQVAFGWSPIGDHLRPPSVPLAKILRHPHQWEHHRSQKGTELRLRIIVAPRGLTKCDLAELVTIGNAGWDVSVAAFAFRVVIDLGAPEGVRTQPGSMSPYSRRLNQEGGDRD